MASETTFWAHKKISVKNQWNNQERSTFLCESACSNVNFKREDKFCIMSWTWQRSVQKWSQKPNPRAKWCMLMELQIYGQTVNQAYYLQVLQELKIYGRTMSGFFTKTVCQPKTHYLWSGLKDFLWIKGSLYLSTPSVFAGFCSLQPSPMDSQMSKNCWKEPVLRPYNSKGKTATLLTSITFEDLQSVLNNRKHTCNAV